MIVLFNILNYEIFFQGLCVATLFCFLNGEVRTSYSYITKSKKLKMLRGKVVAKEIANIKTFYFFF